MQALLKMGAVIAAVVSLLALGTIGPAVAATFDTGATHLPPHFTRDDVATVVLTLQRSGLASPKSEFETTAQWESRRLASLPAGFSQAPGRSQFMSPAFCPRAAC